MTATTLATFETIALLDGVRAAEREESRQRDIADSADISAALRSVAVEAQGIARRERKRLCYSLAKLQRAQRVTSTR